MDWELRKKLKTAVKEELKGCFLAGFFESTLEDFLPMPPKLEDGTPVPPDVLYEYLNKTPEWPGGVITQPAPGAGLRLRCSQPGGKTLGGKRR